MILPEKPQFELGKKARGLKLSPIVTARCSSSLLPDTLL